MNKDEINRFTEWHTERLVAKDMKKHLRFELEKVLADDDFIDRALDSMNFDDIQKSFAHSYKNKLKQMSTLEIIKEMDAWGYNISSIEGDSGNSQDNDKEDEINKRGLRKYQELKYQFSELKDRVEEAEQFLLFIGQNMDWIRDSGRRDLLQQRGIYE